MVKATLNANDVVVMKTMALLFRLGYATQISDHLKKYGHNNKGIEHFNLENLAKYKNVKSSYLFCIQTAKAFEIAFPNYPAAGKLLLGRSDQLLH